MAGGWAIGYSKGGEHRFGIQYDIRKRNQMHYGLRLTRLKAIWERAGELDEVSRKLLFAVTKRCSGCGQCAKAKFKTMGPFTVEHAGERLKLCPWYPASEWRYLDEEKIQGIKGLLDLQETVMRSV